MINNQQSAGIATENITHDNPTKPIYQKPKTSLFLESRNIQGGSTNVPESNSGLLQS